MNRVSKIWVFDNGVEKIPAMINENNDIIIPCRQCGLDRVLGTNCQICGK